MEGADSIMESESKENTDANNGKQVPSTSSQQSKKKKKKSGEAWTHFDFDLSRNIIIINVEVFKWKILIKYVTHSLQFVLISPK